MKKSYALALLLFAIFFAFQTHLDAKQPPPIIGQWLYRDNQKEIVTEFHRDGTFHERVKTAQGSQEYDGLYSLAGQVLRMKAGGNEQQLTCSFEGSAEMIVTYPNGMSIRARRVPSGEETPAVKPAKKEREPATGGVPSGDKPPRILLGRVWEPNEKAFTVLVPNGWITSGGIFNVTPSQTNGPGNSITPKCDFAVMSDKEGSAMIRWAPTWNYADLTYSPTGFTLFKPGSYYQGMLVRRMVSPEQFLIELLKTERPRATDFKVISRDPLNEVTRAFERQAQAVNAELRKMGLRPITIESLGLVVEYTENGRRYRESLMTSIADNRGGAFQWSNENTILFRAPASRFASWKPLLDMIQSSRQANPRWLASVAHHAGKRAKAALETQAYMNRVLTEIAENRSRTQAEIRHDQWLFISGQEEYKNPFTGEVERGTSAYRYRWQNNQGDVLYVDENGFDPNTSEEYNTRQWKRSEVWDRKR